MLQADNVKSRSMYMYIHTICPCMYIYMHGILVDSFTLAFESIGFSTQILPMFGISPNWARNPYSPSHKSLDINDSHHTATGISDPSRLLTHQSVEPKAWQ